jgi:hypothetical protein
MATKTGLTTAISSAITVVITRAKLLLGLDELIDEIYPTQVTDTQTSETYTTKTGTNINYSITVIKSGNIAHIKGTVTNNTSSLLGAQNVFSWKSNEFKPKSGVNDVVFTASNNPASTIRLFLNNNNLTLLSNMQPITTYNFEFQTYITQD